MQSLPKPVAPGAGLQTFARLNAPVFYLAATFLSAGFWFFASHAWALTGLCGLVVWPALAVVHFELTGASWADWRQSGQNAVGRLFRRKASPPLAD